MRLFISVFASFLFVLAFCQSPSFNSPSAKAFVPHDYSFPKADSFRVVAWNVEHFVDEFDNPYINNRRENSAVVDTQKLRLFKEALLNLDADLILLTEFESETYARILADSLFPELGYRFVAGDESPNWYQNIVFLSRFPLGKLSSYATLHSPIIGSDETQNLINTRLLTVEVFTDSQHRILVTGVHLKAGRGKRNEGYRLGQIELLRHYLGREQQNEPGLEQIILGDFNTTPDSLDFETLLGKGTDLEFIDPLQGTSVFSHPSDSAFWRIDHIVPNKNLFMRLIPQTARVERPLPDSLLSVVSDHLPVVAEFLFD